MLLRGAESVTSTSSFTPTSNLAMESQHRHPLRRSVIWTTVTLFLLVRNGEATGKFIVGKSCGNENGIVEEEVIRLDNSRSWVKVVDSSTYSSSSFSSPSILELRDGNDFACGVPEGKLLKIFWKTKTKTLMVKDVASKSQICDQKGVDTLRLSNGMALYSCIQGKDDATEEMEEMRNEYEGSTMTYKSSTSTTAAVTTHSSTTTQLLITTTQPLTLATTKTPSATLPPPPPTTTTTTTQPPSTALSPTATTTTQPPSTVSPQATTTTQIPSTTSPLATTTQLPLITSSPEPSTTTSPPPTTTQLPLTTSSLEPSTTTSPPPKEPQNTSSQKTTTPRVSTTTESTPSGMLSTTPADESLITLEVEILISATSKTNHPVPLGELSNVNREEDSGNINLKLYGSIGGVIAVLVLSVTILKIRNSRTSKMSSPTAKQHTRGLTSLLTPVVNFRNAQKATNVTSSNILELHDLENGIFITKRDSMIHQVPKCLQNK